MTASWIGIPALAFLAAIAATEDGASGLPGGAQELRIAEEPWAFVIDLPGFVIEAEQEREGGHGKMIRAKNEDTGVIVSVFLELEEGLGSPEACRTYYWSKDKKSPIFKSKVRKTERDSKALVEWLVKRFAGLKVMQKNVKAFLAKGEYCVDVHLSKVDYEPEDDGLFKAIVDSARFEER